MNILRNAVAPLVAIFMVACTGTPQAQAEAEISARTITVTGIGEVSAVPDMAILNIGVQSEATTAAAALRDNSARMAATINELKESGVAEKDIQTLGLSVNPRYSYERNRSKPDVIGFTASNSVRVKLRDLTKAGAVIDSAVQSGANSMNGLSFTFSNPKPLQAAARTDAVANARSNAQLLTSAAGVELGRVLIIQDGRAAAPRPNAVRVSAALESADASVPLQAGEATLSAAVTIVYEIK